MTRATSGSAAACPIRERAWPWLEHDRRHDARLLTELGIDVVRFTREAIRTTPSQVLTTLARAIALRERRPGHEAPVDAP